MVVLDSTTLFYLLDPDAKAPTDPKTGLPVSHVRQRVEYLVSSVEKRREKVVIPTPVLSELLVWAGTAGPKYLDILTKSAVFRIADFDQRAAIEAATAIREAIGAGDKRSGSLSPWPKVKFDRQIIAIAKVAGASTIYSDDDDIARLSRSAGIVVVRIQDLPLSPEGSQLALPLDAAEDTAKPDDPRSSEPQG